MDAAPERPSAMGGGSAKPPSRLRSFLVLTALAAVPLAILWLLNPRESFEARAGADTWGHVLAGIVASLFLAAFALSIAVALYLLVFFSGGFTWDYTRPVYKRAKPRVFVANIVVLLFLLFGVALLAHGLLLIPFKLFGVRLSPWMVALFASGLLVSLLSIRFNLWAPLQRRLVVQRQRAAGTPESAIAGGTYVGISDPAVSAWKKGFLEDDMGMMWMEPDRLVYRGDADSFTVSRSQLTEIEREVLAASASAYAGNRHIVLRFAGADGVERRVRLHIEGEWTLGRMAGTMDRLADRLVAWKQAPAPGELPAHPA